MPESYRSAYLVHDVCQPRRGSIGTGPMAAGRVMMVRVALRRGTTGAGPAAAGKSLREVRDTRARGCADTIEMISVKAGKFNSSLVTF